SAHCKPMTLATASAHERLKRIIGPNPPNETPRSAGAHPQRTSSVTGLRELERQLGTALLLERRIRQQHGVLPRVRCREIDRILDGVLAFHCECLRIEREPLDDVQLVA